MFRLFLLAFGLVCLTESTYAQQLLEDLAIKVTALERKVQSLTTRVNGAKVECYDTNTPYDVGSDKEIMFLDRQNVECPHPYFLSRFQLGREGNWNSAKVRYYYKCCKFVL